MASKTGPNQYAPGFSPLSIPFPLLKGIHFMGYNQPTPIQKKCIPILNSGRDVVAMARTGCGKTAAFVIPLLMKLNCTHSARVGVRGLIIAPTRELASQIHVFIESLCRKAHLSLRSACVLGGDSISEQFSMLMSNPDILIGTPGRLLHLLAEVSQSSKDGSMADNFFNAIQLVILDEADRLFEDATSLAQISLLFSRIPASRQVALFSATMPSQLLGFSKTGLKDASLVRLDTEARLSDDLKSYYFDVQVAEKPALLLALLEKRDSSLFDLYNPSEPGGLIFVSTRQIATLLSGILSEAGIKHGVLFGQMDAEARKIIVESFRANQIPFLIVTDVASRGIDIPSLQFVINYDFPATAKLFIHRTGRVARAGRSGTAISFVTIDERPYLMDLEAFLGISKLQLMRLVPFGDSETEDIKARVNDYIASNADLEPLPRVAEQSLLKYQRTRPKASPASYTRAKAIPSRELLPVYSGYSQLKSEGNSFLAQLAAFRPSETVFEAMRKGSKGQRSLINAPELSSIVALRNKKKNAKAITALVEEKDTASVDENCSKSSLFASNCLDLSFKDEKSFVNYAKKGAEYERGLDVSTFSLPEDEQTGSVRSVSGKKRLIRKWDAKKKKYIQREAAESPETILEKSLFGGRSTAKKGSSKQRIIGDVYRSWKKVTHQELPRVGSIETQNSTKRIERFPDFRGRKGGAKGSRYSKAPVKKSAVKSELRNPDQIIKARVKKAGIADRLAAKKEKGKARPPHAR